MGFFDFFSDVGYWISEKFESAVDWIKDKLGGKSYSSSSMEDQIDVDKVLAEFRNAIQNDVSESEAKCMKNISDHFCDLKEKTKTKFPDLIEIIDHEQEKAERELSGTVIKYVKEHLSKNDEDFCKILEMQPGVAKATALDSKAKNVIKEAEKEFFRKLKHYAEHILNEFTTRLDIRITNQEEEMEKSIEELQKFEEESQKDQLDIEALIDSTAPVMESAQCIISILEMEM